MPIAESIQMGLMGAGTIIFALLACESTVDNKKLEEKVSEMFEDDLDLEVKSMKCDEKKIKIKEGKEFECMVSVKPKGKIPIEIELTDNSGSFSVKTKYNVLNPKDYKKKTKIDCGKKIMVLEPGETFKCEQKDGSEIELEVDDDGKLGLAEK